MGPWSMVAPRIALPSVSKNKETDTLKQTKGHINVYQSVIFFFNLATKPLVTFATR